MVFSHKVWRLTHKKHERDAFSGIGSSKWGGRWNSPGKKIVYTASTTSLGILEAIVNASDIKKLKSYIAIGAYIPQITIKTIDIDSLPKNWKNDPPPKKLAFVGDEWILEQKYAVLKVPSAIISHEFNFLINPEHEEFKEIIIDNGTKPFDSGRLLEATYCQIGNKKKDINTFQKYCPYFKDLKIVSKNPR